MHNKGIKIISNSIHYKSPRWLHKSRNIDYIELSKKTSQQETDLFLIGLFGYNSIDFAKNAKHGLRNLLAELNENSLVLGGGFLFYEDDKEIAPSCCCGLEAWQEIPQDILNKKSPWLGHDPCPVVEFTNQSTIIWSDDCLGIYDEKKPKDNLYSIEFDNDILKEELNRAEINLKEFITMPLNARLKELDSENSEEVTKSFLSWLRLF